MKHPRYKKTVCHSAADEAIEAAGWDHAGKGGEKSWYPELKAPPKRSWQRAWFTVKRLLLYAAGGFAVLLVAAWILVPTTCGCTKIATNETAVVQNLKALATAQAQYIKKHDCYAASGWELNASGTLIALDLKNAFEDWHGNGDQRAPQPKAGYVFRMLQGNETGWLAYRKDPNDPTYGMNTWAAVARASEPGTSGENQYYITEVGTVYKMPEPTHQDPRFKTFLLDAAPNSNQLSWATAK